MLYEKNGVINNEKRIICLIIICILIFSVTGCGKSTNTIEKTSNKNGDDLSKYENLSDEEKIWIMANEDDIYDQRIFIRDSILLSSTKDENGDESFFNDLSKLKKLAKSNLFAKKFIELYNKTNLDDILNNGTDLEKYLLYTYLNIKTNHNEGFGSTYNAIKSLDEYPNLVNYKIDSIYQSHFDSSGKLIPNNNQNESRFIFKFISNNEGDKDIYMTGLGYIEDYQTSFYMYEYDYETLKTKMDSWEKSGHKYNKLDKNIIQKVILNNIDFLDFYINYKNNIYYPRYDKENNLTPGGDPARYTNEKTEPFIGMRKEDIEKSSWGKPEKKILPIQNMESMNNGYIVTIDTFILMMAL